MFNKRILGHGLPFGLFGRKLGLEATPEQRIKFLEDELAAARSENKRLVQENEALRLNAGGSARQDAV
jgi:hypothetical protein